MRPFNFTVRRQMSDTLEVLLVLALFLAIAGFSAWKTIRGLQMGFWINRNGLRISRLENPNLFWFGISLGFAVPILVLSMCLWVTGQLLTAGPR